MRQLSIAVYSLVFLSTIFLYQNCGGPFEANHDLSAGTTGTELNIPEGYELIDDMIVKKSSIKRGQVGTQGVGVIDRAVELWPNGVVYYQFDASVTAGQKDIFRNNCRDLGAFANVSCVEGTGSGKYVLVQNITEEVTWCGLATLGMQYAGQTFKISSKCWNIPGLVNHELMHSFGIHHEHMRPDRDDHIVMDFDAIERTGYSAVNFPKLETSSHSTTRYDYDSIMHYTSKLRGQVILWKKGMDKSQFHAKIYWANFPSVYDHRTLQLMYGGVWPTHAQHADHYQNKNAFFDIRCKSGSKKRRLCFRASDEIKVVYMGGSNCNEPRRCQSRNRTGAHPTCQFNKWGHDDGKSRIWVEKGCNARFRIWTKAKTTYVFDSHQYLPGKTLKTYQ